MLRTPLNAKQSFWSPIRFNRQPRLTGRILRVPTRQQGPWCSAAGAKASRTTKFGSTHALKGQAPSKLWSYSQRLISSCGAVDKTLFYSLQSAEHQAPSTSASKGSSRSTQPLPCPAGSCIVILYLQYRCLPPATITNHCRNQ